MPFDWLDSTESLNSLSMGINHLANHNKKPCLKCSLVPVQTSCSHQGSYLQKTSHTLKVISHLHCDKGTESFPVKSRAQGHWPVENHIFLSQIHDFSTSLKGIQSILNYTFTSTDRCCMMHESLTCHRQTMLYVVELMVIYMGTTSVDYRKKRKLP